MGSNDCERLECKAERIGSHDALQNVQEANTTGDADAPPQPSASHVLWQLSASVQPTESIQEISERSAESPAAAVAAKQHSRLPQPGKATLECLRIPFHQLRSQLNKRGRQEWIIAYASFLKRWLSVEFSARVPNANIVKLCCLLSARSFKFETEKIIFMNLCLKRFKKSYELWAIRSRI